MSKIDAVKAAQKFFSEDKERSFEAKVGDFGHFRAAFISKKMRTDDGRERAATGPAATAGERS